MTKITYDEFYNNYITKNLSIKEIADLYNTSETTILRLNANEFHVAKSKELVIACKKRLYAAKYGVDNPMKRKEIANKVNLNRTSYKRRQMTDEEKQKMVEKYKKTCLEKYGCENVFQNKEIQEKIKQTNLQKYGAVNPLQNDNIKNKVKNTNLKRYGVEYTTQDPQTRSKMNASHKATLLSKNGSEEYLKNIYKAKKIPDEYYEILKNKDSFIGWINKTFPDGCSNYDIRQKIDFTEATIAKYIRKYDLYDSIIIPKSRSTYEQEICKFIQSLGINNIETNKTNIISPYEIDIYLPEYKLGIEFNGTYWHSSLFADKKYHQMKSLRADANGIRLIHIYEYEWLNSREKIESLLRIALNKTNTKIYARNCEVREISNNEAKDFNNKNHTQNHRDAKITYGLYYNNILVQLMSFSPHNKYEWEIIRGCPGSNNIVIGGVSKLFNYFIKKNNPSSIFSYCDFNKFNGISYEKIGMKYIGLTGPDLKYINNKSEVINRNPHKYTENKNLIKIYGAGSKKYLWQKDKSKEK